MDTRRNGRVGAFPRLCVQSIAGEVPRMTPVLPDLAPPLSSSGPDPRAAALVLAALAACASPPARARPAYDPAPRPQDPAVQPLAAPRLESGPLDLGQAVALARERNPDLRAAAERVEVARAGLAAASAALYPRIGLDLSVLRSDAPSAYLFKSIDAHSLPPGVDFNDPGTFENTEAGVAVSWNLWNGGRDQLARRSAERGIDLARSGAAGIENALIAAVVAAFLDARAAGELLAADAASLRAVEGSLGPTRARVESGAALRSDLLSLEVRLAEARQRELSSRLAREYALASLRSLLAFEPGEPLLIAAGPWSPADLPESRGAACAAALEGRPEVASARLAIERARLDVDAAGRAYLPRLELEARAWAGETEYTLDLEEPNASIGLALYYDLFEGGSRRAAQDRARALLAELEQRDQRVLLDVTLDAELAWLRRDEARARVSVAQAALAAAEESFALVDQQYRGGSATITRLLETEAALAQARAADVRARIDVERAEAELARAIGRFAPDAAGEEGR